MNVGKSLVHFSPYFLSGLKPPNMIWTKLIVEDIEFKTSCIQIATKINPNPNPNRLSDSFGCRRKHTVATIKLILIQVTS